MADIELVIKIDEEDYENITAPAIIEKDKKQEDNGFFDEIMDESEDEETYEKIKEIIEKVKEQEE